VKCDSRVLFIKEEEEIMNGTTALVVIVVIFAIIALAWMARYRRRGEAQIEVGSAKVTVKGENEPTPDKTAAPPQVTALAASSVSDRPGVNVTDAKSGGGILAEDKTGRGVNVERVETKDDILASSETPPAPKA
jgi:hypothetical protein